MAARISWFEGRAGPLDGGGFEVVGIWVLSVDSDGNEFLVERSLLQLHGCM